MIKKKKIYFITVGRSDFLRQLPIIEYLKKKNNIFLKILITGSHSHKLYGKTLNEIKKTIFLGGIVVQKNIHSKKKTFLQT